MLIDLETLIYKYKISPKGVLHLGAHLGEEAEIYERCRLHNVIWIEANPSLIGELTRNVEKYSTHRVFSFLISDTDGETQNLRITNNGQSSSIFDFGVHKIHYPGVFFTEEVTLTTKTIDTFIDENSIRMENYDFLNIDLQGAELKALQGMKRSIASINYIYTEVNTASVYQGCPLISEMDEFLSSYGFRRGETYMTPFEWGDALYIRG